MLKKLALMLILVMIYVNAGAEEKYLSLPESESTCEKHILFKNRRVMIIDISGEKTELDRLEFEPEGRYYFRFGFPTCGNTFYVLNDMVQLSIPLNMIEYIKLNETTCEVKYSFMNKTKTVAGSYLQGEFTGKGNFGEFKIKPHKIKQIIFTEPAPKIQPPGLNAQLILNNGLNIPVREADMETVDLFKSKYQDSMYYNVYHTDTFVMHSSELNFKKGESNLSVPFKNLSRIEVYPEKGELNLTFKAGQNATGKFLTHDEAKEGTIDGFRGVCDEGGFFVAIEHIKEYRFNK